MHNTAFSLLVSFLNKLSFLQKFLLLGMLCAVPVVLQGMYGTFKTNESISFTKKEQSGIDYIRVAFEPLKLLALHRGLTNAYLQGDQGLRESIISKRKELDAAFNKIVIMDGVLSADLATDNRVKLISSRWQQIKATAFDNRPQQVFQEHTALIEELLVLIHNVANSSNLILDNELASFYLIDTAVMRLPLMVEKIGRARGFGSGVISRGSWDDDSTTRMLLLTNDVREGLAAWKKNLAFSTEVSAKIKDELHFNIELAGSMSQDFLDTIDNQLLGRGDFQMTSSEFFTKGTATIAAYDELFYIAMESLEQLLTARIQSIRMEQIFFSIIVSVMILIVTLLFMGIYYAMMDTARDLKDGAERVASGDLTVRLKCRTRDLMADIVTSFNVMIERFNQLTGQTVEASEQITVAAKQLLEVTQKTDEDFLEQQKMIERIVSAMHEMSMATLEVAKITTAGADEASKADIAAENGCQIVEQTSATIKDLASEVNESAQVIRRVEGDTVKVNSILDVIRSVSEQTNLLALNAAIEAARAGVHGRGFAVVADEVRVLANRTKESAEEIHQTIQGLQNNSQQAVEIMDKSCEIAYDCISKSEQAGNSLIKINEVVDNCAAMNIQIATAAEEQSAVAEEINANVVVIHDLSQETSKNTVKLSVAASELNTLADKLRCSTEQFVLS